jgi:hypothetical protein
MSRLPHAAARPRPRDAMTAVTQLDRTHHFILETFVKRGDAPHYTEIAREFGVSPDEGRGLLHELMNTGLPMWLYPGTDLIASLAPFNDLPTQYRISVDGQQKWFGQCGLESLALCWLFRGRSVQIDSPCLDCGEQLQVVVRDGVIESRDPEGIVLYVDVPISRWPKDWPFT